MKRALTKLGFVIADKLLSSLDRPLTWFDAHFWINVETRPSLGGLGLGSWLGLRLMRVVCWLGARAEGEPKTRLPDHQPLYCSDCGHGDHEDGRCWEDGCGCGRPA